MNIKKQTKLKDGVKYEVLIDGFNFNFVINNNGKVKLLNNLDNKFLFYNSDLKIIKAFSVLFQLITRLQESQLEENQKQISIKIDTALQKLFT